MQNLVFEDITLVCFDSRLELGLEAINNSRKYINFPKILFFTNQNVSDPTIIKKDWKFINHEKYSQFIVKELYKYIETSFILLVQADGYVVNTDAWTNEFLNYDYIGSTWWHISEKVGNGGFSLRSKKLLEATSKHIPIHNAHPEDYKICIDYRNILEKNNIKFAPKELANQFSVENIVYNGSFGFHSITTKKTIDLSLLNIIDNR